ncbi:MAG: type II secretion system protein N [Desulfatibacillaceae bacterium]
MIRHFLPLLYLATITLVVWAMVDTGYRIAAAKLAVPPRVTPTRVEQAPKPDHRMPGYGTYSVVVERDLFKTMVEEPEEEPEQIDVAEIEDTTLRIKLLGTTAGDPDLAYAFIEDQVKRKQDLYQAGESVQGAVVWEIHPRMVVLKRGDKLEKISMGEDSGPSQPGSARLAAASGPGQTINLSRSTVAQSMRDINRLMTQARVRPHFENGRPDGLAISRIKRGSLFTRLGLQDNDVITGVNDKEIRTMEDALSIYRNLQNSSDLALQIKRNGVPQTLDYAIR